VVSFSASFIEKLGNFMPAQVLGLSFWLLENLALFPVALKILENLVLVKSVSTNLAIIHHVY
jgi:hypothetical protein